MLIGSAVNIDSRGEVLTEVSARVVKDESGKPRLEPMPDTKARWYAALNRHAGKGPLRVVLSRVSERRSSIQNRLLWYVYRQVLEGLRELALEAGETSPFRDEDDVHEAMKHLFLGVTVRRFKGGEIEILPSTTTLDTFQFSRYVNNVVAWAAKHGVYVEMPEAS
jgi:hypothetical protein